MIPSTGPPPQPCFQVSGQGCITPASAGPNSWNGPCMPTTRQKFQFVVDPGWEQDRGPYHPSLRNIAVQLFSMILQHLTLHQGRSHVQASRPIPLRSCLQRPRSALEMQLPQLTGRVPYTVGKGGAKRSIIIALKVLSDSLVSALPHWPPDGPVLGSPVFGIPCTRVCR